MSRYVTFQIAIVFTVTVCIMTTITGDAAAEDLALLLRYQTEPGFDSDRYDVVSREEKWKPEETAVIVCDVWDLHHCLNAVRRLEQFAPRLNDVLTESRRRGVTIIHSPSDCMPAYDQHPARQRAIATPVAKRVPHEVATWCSIVPAEERGSWPIDQSDGGEDDDPQEHAEWAAKLKSMGRNPGTPWAKQSELIEIDAEKDFISDRGDEVWNILEARGIQNVVLTGVHTNMCVIGRPFGLRQMARNGKNVVLMRDMTDTMYNPHRWPYVSHFTGTELIIAHIERFVCPTITSGQIIGGEPFKFKGDTRKNVLDTKSEFAAKYLAGAPITNKELIAPNYREHWSPIEVPSSWEAASEALKDYDGVGWYRCTVRVPANWLGQKQLEFEVDNNDDDISGWFNGHPMGRGGHPGQALVLSIESKHVYADDANLLVLRIEDRGGEGGLRVAPTMRSTAGTLSLKGRWQFRIGDDSTFASMPLPAKFGTASDIVFAPPEPLWQARPVTRRGDFTPGIEGPACDLDGNIFAVNYAREGTIGRVRANGAAEVFVELPAGSVGNGIRFHKSGAFFFVADYSRHNVLKVDVNSRKVMKLAHNAAMNQPNDLAIAPDGTLYASDPNWSDSSGQLWRIDPDGTTTRLAEHMGTTNGIEVSPDGKHLYVNESVQRNIWVFDISQDRELTNKRLLKQFADHGFDGMRCDADGNLYVTRYGKGTVVKLTPGGESCKKSMYSESAPATSASAAPTAARSTSRKSNTRGSSASTSIAQAEPGSSGRRNDVRRACIFGHRGISGPIRTDP